MKRCYTDVMNDLYYVKKYVGKSDITVTVPGSKSITNRALLLAALSAKRCLLKGVLFSDDTLAMLACLNALGFSTEIDEVKKEVMIVGCGGKIPNKKAEINVRSAGTAARFLTVVLALSGGEYTINSSQQMKKRPMKPLITILREIGAGVDCLEAEGYFPLRIKGVSYDELSGTDLKPLPVSVDTGISSQFASALLIGGLIYKPGLLIELCGSRKEGAYVAITLKMMAEFGIKIIKKDNIYAVSFNDSFGISEYQIEADMSGACYFYALAVLLNINVCVRNVFLNTIQGDIKFLYLLEKMGAKIRELEEGILVKGCEISKSNGVDADMQDFSDQVMTLAAIAPFARTETIIRNVGHIRHQESDRLIAVLTELRRIGVKCELIDDDTGIIIYPLENADLEKNYEIETYEDHRIAMAFTLTGLKTGKIAIKNPACCGKTFAGFFDIIEAMSTS